MNRKKIPETQEQINERMERRIAEIDAMIKRLEKKLPWWRRIIRKIRRAW